MRGKIEAAKKSQSGKTLGILLGETWYSTKNWELEGMVNTMIEFETSSTDYQGKTIWWLNDYRVVDNTPTQPQQSSAASAPVGAPAPVQHNARDPQVYMPMTSNLVAHAIASGCIKSPDAIHAWTVAAFAAAKSCLEPTAQSSGGMPAEFDDDIPF